MARSSKKTPDRFDDGLSPYEPYDFHGPGDALLDSEVDFDDDTGYDQLPLDQVEALEVGANLDDPRRLDAD